MAIDGGGLAAFLLDGVVRKSVQRPCGLAQRAGWMFGSARLDARRRNIEGRVLVRL